LPVFGAPWVTGGCSGKPPRTPLGPCSVSTLPPAGRSGCRVEKLEVGLWHAYRRRGQRSGRSCRSRMWPPRWLEGCDDLVDVLSAR
jgi:hypothetical protein